MAGSEWLEGDVDEFLLKHDGGLGRCWVCRKAFQLGEAVMYESPNYPRNYILKISRHKSCQDGPSAPSATDGAG
jgi:hypothetical protein